MMTPPQGYCNIGQIKCRCINLWTDGWDNWCCKLTLKGIVPDDMIPATEHPLDALDRRLAEISKRFVDDTRRAWDDYATSLPPRTVKVAHALFYADHGNDPNLIVFGVPGCRPMVGAKGLTAIAYSGARPQWACYLQDANAAIDAVDGIGKP